MRSRLIILVFAVMAALVAAPVSAKTNKVAAFCQQEQAQSVADGFSNFSCDTTAASGQLTHGRHVQVIVRGNEVVATNTTDTTVQRAEGVAAPQLSAMSKFSNIPAGCWTSWVCTATITNSFAAYTSFFGMPGTSYKCAWMNYKQVYDVYAPWYAVLNVRTPQVTGGATWPCSTTQLTNWMQMSNMPYNATTAGVLGYQINLFWQGVGVISSHPGVTRGAWFDGRYNFNGVSYGN